MGSVRTRHYRWARKKVSRNRKAGYWNGDEAAHATDQWVPQNNLRPKGFRCDILCPLQFSPDSLDAKVHACDGSGDYGFGVGNQPDNVIPPVQAKPRPALLEFSSLAELYQHYERLFLGGNEKSHTFTTACGHTTRIFDHNFFHMVKLKDPARPGQTLLMAIEKENILATTEGFGKYTHEKQRAIYLASALECFLQPDEVWEDPTLNSATWIYIREYDTDPYVFTVLLVGGPADGVAPVTSFPCLWRQIKKWRRGKRIWPQNTTATLEGGG